MLKSMTGYGRGEVEAEGKQISIELKSVNHRYLEINLKQPKKYIKLEERIRKTVAKYLNRGHLEIFVRVKNTEQRDTNVKVNVEFAKQYYQALKELGDSLGVENDISLEKIISLPEIISIEESEEDIELIWPYYSKILEEALLENLKMREEEGKNLQIDLLQRVENLKAIKSKIETRSPEVVKEYKEKLTQRIEELLESKEILNEEKLENEVAYFSDRASITEELVRLDSHFEQFNKITELDGPVGRKLDFLIQEMNREVNTIGSKANDKEISANVVEMKAEIEKIREQVQNIE